MKIIITGASRGIGYYLAKRLYEDGYEVVGVARNFSEDTPFKTTLCDVKDLEAVTAAFRVLNGNNDIYALINCAGVLHTKPVISISDAYINEIIDTNLKGTIYCCKNVIRPLLKFGSGRIINFSSIAASSALKGDSVYSASKSAVETFSKALAKEIATKPITVNCIAPGIIKTQMTKDLKEAQIDKLLSLQIIPNLGEVNDIYNVVKFVLSEESNMISGQIFNIGGV
jgi:3-oxoacyl-[acyl-carrier protein] reductase